VTRPTRLLPVLLLLGAAAAAPALAADAADAAKPKPAAATPALPYTLPARMEAHRFFIDATAPDGQVLHLFTDTAGATNLSVSGADKLGIPYKMPARPREQAAGETRWPAYAGAWLPPPLGGKDPEVLPILVPPPGIAFDGMLGARWFADRTWEWDYRAGTLRLLPPGALPKTDAAHVVKVGFRKDADGAKTTSFPRIPVEIAGEELQMLFGTGATFASLTEEAAARLDGGKADAHRAGSFIAYQIVKRWHEAHPDWPWLERGESGLPMIQVPDMVIAGWHTGPVWFAARATINFRNTMAQWTDMPLDGLVGGNALASFRITLDYPSETAVFEQLPPAP